MRAPPLRVQRYSPGELPGNAPQASVHMAPATSSTHKACSRTWSKCRKVVTINCQRHVHVGLTLGGTICRPASWQPTL